jgi:hypothetical protein
MLAGDNEYNSRARSSLVTLAARNGEELPDVEDEDEDGDDGEDEDGKGDPEETRSV